MTEEYTLDMIFDDMAEIMIKRNQLALDHHSSNDKAESTLKQNGLKDDLIKLCREAIEKRNHNG